MESYDVAVIVIARVPGVDIGDAAERLEIAMRRRFGRGDESIDTPGPGITDEKIVPLYITEAGSALRNGFLAATLTNKAARLRGM